MYCGFRPRRIAGRFAAYCFKASWKVRIPIPLRQRMILQTSPYHGVNELLVRCVPVMNETEQLLCVVAEKCASEIMYSQEHHCSAWRRCFEELVSEGYVTWVASSGAPT